ncbi:MAG: hypothetical protein R8G66_31935 [Cytophagales bacterium]|nr:hypothetical protein [Cytophagales bacterium]
MANMGMDFRAPKTSKKKEWEIVRGMYKVGHRFQTCGCLGPGLIPKDSESYYHYLNEIRIEYKTRLEERSTVQSPEELSEYIAYWDERLNRIENELSLAIN